MTRIDTRKDGEKMRILLAEDDRNLSEVMASNLEKAGFGVDCCYDGEAAFAWALDGQRPYDLAVLDRMLPTVDGLTILKAMRSKKIQIPVILVTALGTLENRLEGFDTGADDYLVKPFAMAELLARVRALVRRPRAILPRDFLRFGDLALDCEKRRLACGGATLLLTQREAEVLEAMLEKPDRTHGREELLWKVWGADSLVEAGNVDNYIHFLRKRLRELGSRVAIETVYGSGYRLEAP